MKRFLILNYTTFSIQKKSLHYSERTIESSDWVTLIIVGCFILFAIAKTMYPKRFEEFTRLPFSNNYFLAKGKTEEIRHPFSWFLFVVQIISISLFINLFVLEEHKSNFQLFIRIITSVIVFVIVKFSIEKIIGNIFSIEKTTNQYLYEKLSYRNLAAILLFIANLFFYLYATPNLHTLLITTGIFVFINLVILYFSFKKHRTLIYSNFFYFLLYLCTLEISPYIILYKVVV